MNGAAPIRERLVRLARSKPARATRNPIVGMLSRSSISNTVFESIRQWLDKAGILYHHLHHEPTYTSEEAARVRGEDIRVGGKALLLKIGDVFHLFVLSAALKFNSSAVERRFGVPPPLVQRG